MFQDGTSTGHYNMIGDNKGVVGCSCGCSCIIVAIVIGICIWCQIDGCFRDRCIKEECQRKHEAERMSQEQAKHRREEMRRAFALKGVAGLIEDDCSPCNK